MQWKVITTHKNLKLPMAGLGMEKQRQMQCVMIFHIWFFSGRILQ